MICVSHLTALDLPPEDMVIAAARAGFSGVGLRIFPPAQSPDQYPVWNDRARIRSLRDIARDHGIRIFEAESFGMGAEVDRTAYARAVEAAAELGAGVITSAGIDDDAGRLAANYHWLAETAAGHGLVLAMEFMPYRGMKTLEAALKMHRRVDHPRAKLLIDAIHLSRSGAGLAEMAAIPDRSAIGHFHICDAPAIPPAQLEDKLQESRTGRLYPGEGGLPLSDLLALLPEGCPISLEAPHRDQQGWAPQDRIAAAGRVTLDWFRRHSVEVA